MAMEKKGQLLPVFQQGIKAVFFMLALFAWRLAGCVEQNGAIYIECQEIAHSFTRFEMHNAHGDISQLNPVLAVMWYTSIQTIQYAISQGVPCLDASQTCW